MVSLVLDKLSVIFICYGEFDGRTSKRKELSCKNRALHWMERICLAVRVDNVSGRRVLDKEQEFDLFLINLPQKHQALMDLLSHLNTAFFLFSF